MATSNPNPTTESDRLAAINSATLGTSMPVITLPDGKKVQTGTIGALMVNIKTYDDLVATRGGASGSGSVGDADADTDEKLKDLEEKFRAALPLAKHAGLLDLFRPEEWIAGGRSAGRRRVGELAVEMGFGGEKEG